MTEQRRVTLPESLMKAAKAIGESPDMKPSQKLEAIVLVTHGCGLGVAAAAEGVGLIDSPVNNAGALVRRVPITEIDDEVFDDIIDLNVRSMMMCTRYAVPFMTGGGSIINLTSVAARHGGGPGRLCPGRPVTQWARGSRAVASAAASSRGTSAASTDARRSSTMRAGTAGDAVRRSHCCVTSPRRDRAVSMA